MSAAAARHANRQPTSERDPVASAAGLMSENKDAFNLFGRRSRWTARAVRRAERLGEGQRGRARGLAAWPVPPAESEDLYGVPRATE